jgi:tripartite-type tricarboxylate transporter receptor subunit TctC
VTLARAAIAAAALCLGVLSGSSTAQSFPERPLRLVVGQAAGTSPDVVARALAAKWAEFLGQPVFVDNRPGAAESIAAEAVAKAAPDGHTILFGSIASHGIGPALSKKLSHDPARDFAPISLIGTVPNVLVVHPSLPAANLGQFVAHLKANPGKLNYASTGVGTSTHLGMELLKAKAGLDIIHVPYKSGSAAFTDVIGGQVAAGLFNLPSQLPLIRAGKLRAIGVSSLKRSTQLPDVPTLDESGAPGYEVVVWYALFAPAGIRRAVHERLRADLMAVMQTPELREVLAGRLGLELATSTPEELADYSRREIEKWSRVAREAGISTDQ